MAVKRAAPTSDLPGNDGRWFLELIGVASPRPAAREAIAGLAASTDAAPSPPGTISPAPASSESTGTVVAVEGIGQPPTGSALSFDDEAHPPLPAETPPPGQVGVALPPDWEPDDVAPTLRSPRRVRLGAIIATAIAATVVVAGVAIVPRLTTAKAARLATQYRTALVELRNALPDAQASLATFTDPTTDTVTVTQAVPAVAALDNAAHDVGVLADAPLPSTLPLVPRGPIDALAPVRDEMKLESAEGSRIALELGHIFRYRTAIPAMLQPGPLPTEADATTINSLSVTLASSLADDTALAAGLPDSATFQAVDELVTSTLTRYEAWQGEYLVALKAGDTAEAEQLVAELEGLRNSLNTALTEALGEARTTVDADILALAQTLEGTIDAI